ncbi:MAG: diguanylate cyclase, partial [Gammaproteobacteria bacterium]|nr:diguanylate cyclase [Gammaproteobacteria bacterium]
MRYSNPDLFEQAVNESDLGIIVIDAQFKIALWNGWMVKHSGKTALQALGNNLLDVCPELENSRVFEAITNTLGTGQPAVISNVLNRRPFALFSPFGQNQLSPEHTRIQQAVKIVPISISTQANYCLVQISDVSASVKRERALEQQVKDRKLIEQKLSQERNLFIAGPTVVLTWRTKPQWQIDYISPNITQQFGYQTEQFIDGTLYFPDLIHEDDIDVFLENLEGGKAKNQAHVEQEFRILDAFGQYRWVYNLTSINRNMQGEVSDYFAYMLDISQRKLYQEKIEHQAYFDELTGLPNRRMFLDRLQREFVRAKRRDYMGALFFIDLDRFKMINDTLGHEVGDQLLQMVAKRLQGCLRADDTAARLGGDEFVVILSDLGTHRVGITHTALVVAEKVRNALGEKYIINGNEIASTPSIGIVTFPAKNQATAEDLIRYADTAMYQAKNDGRNEIRFFSPEMQEQVDHQQQLEKSLRNAIELNQFTLNFQPSFNIHKEIVNTEVLLRWCHPEHGWISPAEFIPVAEETGFILPLGEWVLRETCRQLKAWETTTAD